MRTVITIISIIFLSSQVTAQIDLFKFRLKSMKLKCTYSNSKDTIKKFNKVLDKLIDEEIKQSKMTGSITSSLIGNTSESKRVYNIISGISLNRGNYPNEVKFKSNIIASFKEDKFSEDVSDIYLAYDHAINEKVEGFVFMNRYSNNYLSIDRRYEIGGGVNFSICETDNLTEHGVEEKNKIISDLFSRDLLLKSKWFEEYTDKKGVEKEKIIDDLINTRNNVETAIKKEYTKFIFRVLIGVFSEFEKTTLSSNFQYTTNNGHLVGFEESIESINQFWKFELRPTLSIKPNDVWSLKFKPYLKIPLLSPLELIDVYEINDDGLLGEFYKENNSIDYRIDATTELTFLIPISSTNKSNVKISVEHIYNYDSAPPQNFKKISRFNDEIRYFIANKSHNQITFNVGITF